MSCFSSCEEKQHSRCFTIRPRAPSWLITNRSPSTPALSRFVRVFIWLAEKPHQCVFNATFPCAVREYVDAKIFCSSSPNRVPFFPLSERIFLYIRSQASFKRSFFTEFSTAKDYLTAKSNKRCVQIETSQRVKCQVRPEVKELFSEKKNWSEKVFGNFRRLGHWDKKIWQHLRNFSCKVCFQWSDQFYLRKWFIKLVCFSDDFCFRFLSSLFRIFVW